MDTSIAAFASSGNDLDAVLGSRLYLQPPTKQKIVKRNNLNPISATVNGILIAPQSTSAFTMPEIITRAAANLNSTSKGLGNTFTGQYSKGQSVSPKQFNLQLILETTREMELCDLRQRNSVRRGKPPAASSGTPSLMNSMPSKSFLGIHAPPPAIGQRNNQNISKLSQIVKDQALQSSTMMSFEEEKEQQQPVNQVALKTYLNARVNKSERNSPKGMYLSSLAQKKRNLIHAPIVSPSIHMLPRGEIQPLDSWISPPQQKVTSNEYEQKQQSKKMPAIKSTYAAKHKFNSKTSRKEQYLARDYQQRSRSTILNSPFMQMPQQKIQVINGDLESATRHNYFISPPLIDKKRHQAKQSSVIIQNGYNNLNTEDQGMLMLNKQSHLNLPDIKYSGNNTQYDYPAANNNAFINTTLSLTKYKFDTHKATQDIQTLQKTGDFKDVNWGNLTGQIGGYNQKTLYDYASPLLQQVVKMRLSSKQLNPQLNGEQSPFNSQTRLNKAVKSRRSLELISNSFEHTLKKKDGQQSMESLHKGQQSQKRLLNENSEGNLLIIPSLRDNPQPSFFSTSALQLQIKLGKTKFGKTISKPVKIVAQLDPVSKHGGGFGSIHGNPGKTEFMVTIPRKENDAIEEGGIDDQTTDGGNVEPQITKEDEQAKQEVNQEEEMAPTKIEDSPKLMHLPIYASTIRLHDSPFKESNNEILESNKTKKQISIISNLYRIDARTIKFQKAREELIRMNTEIVQQRMQKKDNSRRLISHIQYEENLRRAREKQLELKERRDDQVKRAKEMLAVMGKLEGATAEDIDNAIKEMDQIHAQEVQVTPDLPMNQEIEQ